MGPLVKLNQIIGKVFIYPKLSRLRSSHQALGMVGLTKCINSRTIIQ